MSSRQISTTWWTSVLGDDDLALQVELAPANARQVQEIVDQAGFQGDVAADHLQHRTRSAAGRSGVVEHRRRGGEDGGQRGAELVAQRGEEAVLGPAGRLGLGPRRLLAEHPHPLFLVRLVR